MCVCVWERERGRKRGWTRERERERKRPNIKMCVLSLFPILKSDPTIAWLELQIIKIRMRTV